jgi:hypothetical protein
MRLTIREEEKKNCLEENNRLDKEAETFKKENER